MVKIPIGVVMDVLAQMSPSYGPILLKFKLRLIKQTGHSFFSSEEVFDVLHIHRVVIDK